MKRKPQKTPTPTQPQTQAMGVPKDGSGGRGTGPRVTLYFELGEKGDPTSNHLFFIYNNKVFFINFQKKLNKNNYHA